MTDYAAEQEMELEALEAILMEDLKEVEGQSAEGLGTDSRCFRIVISPKDSEEDEEPTEIPVRLALVFAHSPTYPDEPPLLQVRSIRGIRDEELKELQGRLDAEVEENMGMAMIFTLATSAKEWLREKVSPEGGVGGTSGMTDEEKKRLEDEEEQKRIQAARAAGVPVTPENFTAWKEKYDAEIALERAKAPGAAEAFERKKRMSGRAYFESGAARGHKVNEDGIDEGEDFDDDDDEDFLDDLLDENDDE